MKHEKPTLLDLFSGIGGFSLAFEAEGFRTIGFCEVNDTKKTILKAHYPDVPQLGDIKKLCRRIYDYEQRDGEAYCPRCEADFGDCECIGTDQFLDTYGRPDVITGGVPCQPASALGQMRGTQDERWLWPDSIRVVRELGPRYAVFENPPSILVLESGRAWNGIVSELAASGYDCWWDVFPAAAFGAGHLRERVILIASNAARLTERISSNAINAKPTERNAWAFSSSSGHISTAAHANSTRPQGHAGNGAGSEGRTPARRPVAAPDLRGRVAGSNWWHEANTGIPVLAHGLPSRLVEAACLCAGESIVPQVAQVFARAIYQQLRPL